MSEPKFDPDAIINAMAPLLGLAVTPESRPQIKMHLTIAASHAAKLFEVEISDHEEPAPVFTP